MEIKLFEAFAGYGSQFAECKTLGLPVESVGTCEIEPEAIIAYAFLHELNNTERYKSAYEWAERNINKAKEYLIERNIGWDFKKGKSRILRMNKGVVPKLYAATLAQNCVGDVSLVNPSDLPDMDFFTYSFPCQDISVAGVGKGFEENSGTRSSLLWECRKIIKAKKPKFLMMENVKNLVGKKNKPNFDKWLEWLDLQGYNTYWKVTNAKWKGVPQNRERVFAMSILKEYDDGSFKFNPGCDYGVRLKHILEPEVDEKYYLDDDKVERLISKLIEKGELIEESTILRKERNEYGKKVRKQYESGEIQESRHNMTDYMPRPDGISNTLTSVQKDNYLLEPQIYQTPRGNNKGGLHNVAPTVTSNCYHENNKVIEPQIKQLGNLIETESFGGNTQPGRVYDPNGIAPTLNTCGGGGREPKILVEGNVSATNHGGENVHSEDGISLTVNATAFKHPVLVRVKYRIRKLTPKECFRLMGLTDEEIDRIFVAGISNSKMYKMAGNSIVKQQMGFLANVNWFAKKQLEPFTQEVEKLQQLCFEGVL